MTRRNRQKLHRELRLKAEARQARAAVLRRQRHALVQTRDLAVRRVLAGPHSRPAQATPQSAHLASMRQLMRLAHVPGSTQGRVVRLVQVATSRMPRMAQLTRLPSWLLLARQGWVRMPEQWICPSGAEARKLRSLVRHLLVRWDAPEFLVRAPERVPDCNVARVPTEDEWAVVALAHLGRGESLRTLVDSPRLPTPLTRRMVKYFLKSPARFEPVYARRRASLWSLRHEDGHRLTVEVSLGSGAVVQVKRKANAQAQGSDLAVVRAWAEAAALRVRV